MKKFVCLALCTLLWAGLVQAQGVTTGSMSGVVVDPNQDPLPGVAVVATLPATGNRYGTVTDVEGRFRMVNLKAGGPYEVQASLAGFKTHTLGDVTIRLGETTEPGDRAPARGGDRRDRGHRRVEPADQRLPHRRRQRRLARGDPGPADHRSRLLRLARTNPFMTVPPRTRIRLDFSVAAATRATTTSDRRRGQQRSSSVSPTRARRAATPTSTPISSTQSRRSQLVIAELRRPPGRLLGRQRQRHHQVGDQQLPRRPLRLYQQRQLGRQRPRLLRASSAPSRTPSTASPSAARSPKDKLFFFANSRPQRL